uniref:Uncharacterized protein n=1 Tax=Triticum urartu TaxID=4572 RepID=A0A8R7U5F2_TRIUA
RAALSVHWLSGDGWHVLEPLIKRLANGVDDESDVPELLRVDDVAAVEDESRLLHDVVHAPVVEAPEVLPLGQDADGVRVAGGLVRVRRDGDRLLIAGLAHGLQVPRVVPVELSHGEVAPHLLLRHLRVVDADDGLVPEQAPAHVDGRRLARVARVLLEGEPQHGHLLPRDGVEHGGDDAVDEAALLVVVDADDLPPVLCHLGEAVALADVDEVEDVLLEAGAAEADAGGEEARADARVLADGAGHLGDVSAGGLAQRGDGVDGGDALREEGVGGELGQLGRPEVGGDDAVLGDPARVHALEDLHGGLALGGLAAADEDAVGREEVPHGGALGEELRVGQDLVADAAAVVGEDLLDGLRGLDGHGGLLDHDLVGAGDVGDHARGALPVGEVGGLAGAEAAGLGGGVDGDEDDVRLAHVPLHVGAEEEVAAAAALDDVVQAGLVDGEAVAVPAGDARLGDVHHHHLHVRALERDHRHRRATHVARADAADLHHLSPLSAFFPWN